MFRILIWFAFLVVYSQAGKRLHPVLSVNHTSLKYLGAQ
jgi:hypothetical protein